MICSELGAACDFSNIPSSRCVAGRHTSKQATRRAVLQRLRLRRQHHERASELVGWHRASRRPCQSSTTDPSRSTRSRRSSFAERWSPLAKRPVRHPGTQCPTHRCSTWPSSIAPSAPRSTTFPARRRRAKKPEECAGQPRARVTVSGQDRDVVSHGFLLNHSKPGSIAMTRGEWTDVTVIRLRQLWSEGHSTAEIGRRLGFSKNAVGGKTHRLDLPARPSPIRAAGSGNPSPLRRPPVPTLAEIMPLRSLEVPHAAKAAEPPLMTATARDTAPAPIRFATAACCWPLGEPGAPNFRFCDALVVAGRPYCDAHCRAAYRTVRDRQANTA